MSFKILHRPFVFLGGGFGFEGAEVAALSCLRIFLSRIEAITGSQLPNHNDFVSRESRMPTLLSRTSTLNVFKLILAGPLVTSPVRTSKHELCQGH